MIIVTGVDNTGKSSLVEHISKVFDIPIAKRYSPLPPINGEDWYRWVKQQFEEKDELVYDRFFIDELVYGPTLRGKYICSISKMAVLSAMLVIKQPLFIYTQLTAEKIKESFDLREQHPEKGQIERLLNKFNRVIRTWPVKDLSCVTRFNYTLDPDYRRIECVVKNYLQGGVI